MQPVSKEKIGQFKLRRSKLFAQMAPRSIAILPGAPLLYRNHDAEYPFRQNSNFYYLTGFTEPGAVLVLQKEDPNLTRVILFCEDKDPEMEIWDGPRFGIDEAEQYFGMDKAYSLSQMNEILSQAMSESDKIYYSLGCQNEMDARMVALAEEVCKRHKRSHHLPEAWVDFISMIQELRIIKDAEEIKLIRKACQISALAHKRLMQLARPGLKEYELEAEFLYACHLEAARHMAYTSIVATGVNACTLHYIMNNSTLQNNELLLVDAGCEYEYYASDITRTFPVEGKFTEPQRAIYELVLSAQMKAIDQVKPGIHWNKIQEIILNILVEGLIRLGIMQGNVEKLIEEKAYKPFYMHSSGHWLGLDVHDGGSYKHGEQWRTLAPGMVFTIEPGLYFSPKNTQIDAQWRGIGVRIEDDILVTENGCEVLSQAVPKTVEAIEQLMQQHAKV